jgi:transposase
MGQATNLALRERLMELRQGGQTLKAISEALGLPYSTTKKLNRRFREKGELGLAPDYQNCGKQSGYIGEPYQELARQLKELHPGWGAPRLRVELSLTQQPPGKLPSIRTLQRWYRKWGLIRPRRKGAEPTIGRSTAPHNIWEVDAKENLSLSDGRPGCYLTIGDEKSGAWLEALVFPLS